MKVSVAFKWTRDPRDARISVDGELTWGHAKMAATDDDPAAMQVAGALSPEGDIVGVTVGDGDNAWAAARGAARTVVVEGVPDSPDASRTARAIAQGVGAAGPVDAVVIGDSDWGIGVPVALAAELGMPAFAGVVQVEPSGGAFRVSCKDGPLVNVIEARPPFVLAVRGLTSEKAAPGMKQVLAARKKPVEKLVAAGPGAGGSGAPGAPGTPGAPVVTEGAVSLPEGGSATMIDAADVGRAARELVGALRLDGVL